MQPLTRAVLPSLRAECLTNRSCTCGRGPTFLVLRSAGPAKGSDGQQTGVAAGSRRPCQLCRASFSEVLNVTISNTPSERDQVGVPESLEVIENGNDLGGDPDQEEIFLPASAYCRICGNFQSISSLTRLISFRSVTGFVVPPMDRPRIPSQLK